MKPIEETCGSAFYAEIVRSLRVRYVELEKETIKLRIIKEAAEAWAKAEHTEDINKAGAVLRAALHDVKKEVE